MAKVVKSEKVYSKKIGAAKTFKKTAPGIKALHAAPEITSDKLDAGQAAKGLKRKAFGPKL